MVAPGQGAWLGRGRAPARWLGPLPVWARPGPAGLRLIDADGTARPAILRFDHDDFMAEYLDLLQRHPERLGEWLAQPETWRRPMPRPQGAQPAPADSDAGLRQVAFVYERTRRESARRRLPSAVALAAGKPRLRPAAPDPGPEEGETPLKLYQAAQMRHYLVCASLVCEQPGLPDRLPDSRRGERAGFVVRRLLPPQDQPGAPLAAWEEWAFVPAASGNTWQRLGRHGDITARRLAAGEELLPMFATAFAGDCGAARHLFCGTIPVNRREQWLAAALGGEADQPGGQAAVAGRSHAALLLQADVVAPWKALLEQAEQEGQRAGRRYQNLGEGTDTADRARALRAVRDRLQTGSWYVLLDLAAFLRDHLPAVWACLRGEKPLAELDQPAQALVSALRGARLGETLKARLRHVGPGPAHPHFEARYRRGGPASLAEALVAALAAGPGLERVGGAFAVGFDEAGEPLPIDAGWPDFLFPLADPQQRHPAPEDDQAGLTPPQDDQAGLAPPLPAVAPERLKGLQGLARSLAAVDALGELIEALLPARAGEPAEAVPAMAESGEAWFILRCVYQRPACGPLAPPVLSAPSRRFQMAAFFDPDAPARPVRIPMPMDISPAGLRKYQKNTGLVLSDMLCGKIKGIRRLGLVDLVLSVLPWPLRRDLPDPGDAPCKDSQGQGLGMILSLSIPIVTLCALILMMIMVSLFDALFRWLPWLFTWRPVVGLKGKKTEG